MNRPLDRYDDIHTHDRSLACSGRHVVSLSPGEAMEECGTYSVGIHPWDTVRTVDLHTLRALVAAAHDPRTVAIGECGFDMLRGGPPEYQQAVFDFQARLAARTGKPLIIHAVRADHMLLAAVRRHRPAPGMWIIHGYRGRPAAAKPLLDAGLAFSLGKKFNADTEAIIPPLRLYRETDTVTDGL